MLVSAGGLGRYEPIIVAVAFCLWFVLYPALATALLIELFLSCYATAAWLRAP